MQVLEWCLNKNSTSIYVVTDLQIRPICKSDVWFANRTSDLRITQIRRPICIWFANRTSDMQITNYSMFDLINWFKALSTILNRFSRFLNWFSTILNLFSMFLNWFSMFLNRFRLTTCFIGVAALDAAPFLLHRSRLRWNGKPPHPKEKPLFKLTGTKFTSN